jgi:hypothetical protein
MPEGSMAAVAPVPTYTSKLARSKRTNRPDKRFADGRSSLARRVRDLAWSYAAQLGGWHVLSETLAANVRRAGELVALAEKARLDALSNGDIDPIKIARLEGAANRAVRALQLDQKREPAGLTLADPLPRPDARAIAHKRPVGRPKRRGGG